MENKPEILRDGDPGWIRTSDLQLRRLSENGVNSRLVDTI